MTTAFRWPVPPGCHTPPVWTGRGFQVGVERRSLLSYAVGDSGWTDDLTAFHEDNAGSDHFIDRASREHALRQAKLHATGTAPIILEVGCSSGFFLDLLRKELPHALVIGADYVRGPLDGVAARMPDVPLLQFDLTHCPLQDESVDVVVLLNVLEHIEDHEAALRETARILRPGGAAVIEVPAGPHLFDVYDKVLMHYRRYDLSGLRGLLERAGFCVARASSLGAFLYPAFWYVKQKNKRYLSAPEEVQQRIVAGAIRKTGRNRLCEMLLALEAGVRRLLPLPFGIRCLATAVKPAASLGAAARTA
jgi:ubiquinone/menaquinone biosynthesis C-methylase UbiE